MITLFLQHIKRNRKFLTQKYKIIKETENSNTKICIGNIKKRNDIKTLKF